MLDQLPEELGSGFVAPGSILTEIVTSPADLQSELPNRSTSDFGVFLESLTDSHGVVIYVLLLEYSW